MRDLRDPAAMGRTLLHAAGRHRELRMKHEWPRLSEVADYARGTLEDHVPDYPGDESPLDRYGDPRDQHVVVETVRRVLPIERLAHA